MTPHLTEFLSLALVHFLAVVSPGPDFAVTVRQSVKHGYRVGVSTSLGIGVGISVHVLYTVFGIGALLVASTTAFTVVRYLGATYLLYLAASLLRAKPAVRKDFELEERGAEPVPAVSKAFFQGFMTNATNPKATLFFVAIFATIVSPATPVTIKLCYGVWMCMVNALSFTFVSFVFSRSQVRQRFLLMGHWFERIMGVLLGFFGVRLIVG